MVIGFAVRLSVDGRRTERQRTGSPGDCGEVGWDHLCPTDSPSEAAGHEGDEGPLAVRCGVRHEAFAVQRVATGPASTKKSTSPQASTTTAWKVPSTSPAASSLNATNFDTLHTSEHPQHQSGPRARATAAWQRSRRDLVPEHKEMAFLRPATRSCIVAKMIS